MSGERRQTPDIVSLSGVFNSPMEQGGAAALAAFWEKWLDTPGLQAAFDPYAVTAYTNDGAIELTPEQVFNVFVRSNEELLAELLGGRPGLVSFTVTEAIQQDKWDYSSLMGEEYEKLGGHGDAPKETDEPPPFPWEHEPIGGEEKPLEEEPVEEEEEEEGEEEAWVWDPPIPEPEQEPEEEGEPEEKVEPGPSQEEVQRVLKLQREAQQMKSSMLRRLDRIRGIEAVTRQKLEREQEVVQEQNKEIGRLRRVIAGIRGWFSRDT